MKKALTLILTLVLCLSLCACGGSKNVNLGDTVKKGIAQITIKDIQMANTNYVIANNTSDNFLSPIAEDDLQLDDNYIKSAKEDEAPIVITMVIENVGKNDLTIHPFDYVINYDKGNKYSADTCYVQVENTGWTKFDSANPLKLEKAISGATEIRIAVWVPNVIIDSTASLTLDFHGFTYKIR